MAYKMKGFSGFGNSPLKQETIKRGRKKHARSIRPKAGEHFPGQEEGSQSTHLMRSDIVDNPTGIYKVWPGITNKTESGKYEDQSPEEASKTGEVYEFKNKRRAERFEAGSWKKGKDRRKAMKAYRQRKREERKKDSKKIHPDNVTEAQKRQARDNYKPKWQNVDELD